MNRTITALSLLLVILTIAAIGGWFWLQGKVKEGLSAGIASSLNSEVQFEEVWLSLLSGRVEARNGTLQSRDSSAAWQSATVERISGKFSLKKLFASETPVQIEIDRVTITLQKASVPSSSNASSGAQPPSKQNEPSQWPNIQVRKIIAKAISVSGPEWPISLKDAEAEVEKKADGNAWRGVVRVPALSLQAYNFGPSQIEFTSDNQEFRIDAFSLQADKGSITGRANFPTAGKEPGKVHFELKQAPVSMLIPSKWQVIIQGLATGSGDYNGPALDWVKGETKAQITLEEAKLQSLPLLEKLSLIPGLTDLASVKLDQAKSDLLYKEGTFTFTNLAVTKDKRLSWQGSLTIRPDGSLDGATMLGVPASVVSLLPPLKEKIFNTEQDGYAWTPVKISGTAEKIEEDLSPRLIALAQESGGKTLEQGKSLIDEGMKKAGELLDSFLTK